MTKEMVNVIIKLALRRLLYEDIEELKGVVEWIEPEHIVWCLKHYQTVLQDDKSVKQLLSDAMILLEGGRLQ